MGWWAVTEVCGHGVVAGWGECGEAIGIFGWEGIWE